MPNLIRKQPKVAIIITTFNQRELLFECLNSLKKKTDYKNYEIYFVDDSGEGRIGKEIKQKYPYVDVSINKRNLGFSKANNIGIKKALKEYGPEYVLLLNDDTETIQRNWLKKIIEVGESNKKIGILGCRILYPTREMQNIGGYLKKWEIVKELKDRKDIFDVDHVMGAFLLIKRSVIEKIGLLDEIYSPFLLEDTDYCLRAKKSGFLIKSVGNVKIIHHKGKSIDSLKNKKILFVRFKNDIIFSLRHLKLKYALFRIFIYLPLVGIFKKRRDEDELKFKNFIVRKDFIVNLGLYFISLMYTPIKAIFRR